MSAVRWGIYVLYSLPISVGLTYLFEFDVRYRASVKSGHFLCLVNAWSLINTASQQYWSITTSRK